MQKIKKSKISKKYAKAKRKKPNIISLENGDLNGTTEEYIESIGESRINDEGVQEEEFFEIEKTEGGCEFHVLEQFKDHGRIRKLYFEGKIDYSQIGVAVETLEEGDSLRLHIIGKDTNDLVRKLEPYISFKTDESLREQSETVLGQENLENRLYQIRGNSNEGYMAEVEVINKRGLHARPAGEIVEASKNYVSNAQIQYGEKTSDTKSIMGLMILGAAKGTKLIISTDNEKDAEAHINEVVSLFKSGFGEV